MNDYTLNYTFNFSGDYSNNFRENYQNIARLREDCPDIPIILHVPRKEVFTPVHLRLIFKLGNISFSH
jgi:hypothetical protein